jgi:hypothetical protein
LGVIEIGGVTQIILRAPNEQFTRYVSPGQRISNGQVLVKRVERVGGIDNALRPTPVVVLEELGQEVYKEVGAGVEEESPEKPSQAQAPVGFGKG